MPLQNRVQPTGDIFVHPARGLFMGNRGVLHDDARTLTHRRWRHKAWVCCVTKFKNRQRMLMTPNRYTELFFHDEAVALAAGHRPCGECRRSDFNRFLAAADHAGKVTEFDEILHEARAIPRRFEQKRHFAAASSLPDGTFILTENAPALFWQGAMFEFSPSGYSAAKTKPQGTVRVITPAPTLCALKNGYQPRVALD